MKKIIVIIFCFMIFIVSAKASTITTNYTDSTTLYNGVKLTTATIEHTSTDSVARLRSTSNSSQPGNAYVEQFHQVTGSDESMCIRSAYVEAPNQYVECTYSTNVANDVTYGHIWFNTSGTDFYPFTYIID